MFGFTPEEQAQLLGASPEERADRIMSRTVARCLEELATILNDNATTNGEVAIAEKLAERAKELEAEREA